MLVDYVEQNEEMQSLLRDVMELDAETAQAVILTIIDPIKMEVSSA